MKEIDLSIIIISFNTKDLLKNCINSVYEATSGLNYEIIVVDNASKDGSPEMIEAQFKGIKLIKNTANLGFAKANNHAMKIAKGKYFLLLNSDTIIKGGAIETLVRFIDEHPNVAAVGPKVLNLDGTTQSIGGHFPSITRAMLDLSRLDKVIPDKIKYSLFGRYYWMESIAKRVGWLVGCCIVLKKEVVDKIGGFSEEFYFYGEDEEWCYRAHKSGYEIWYLPSSEIHHISGGSRANKFYELKCEGHFKLYKNSFGRHKGIIISLIGVLSITITLINALLKGTTTYRQHVLNSLKWKIQLLKRLITKP